MKNDYFENLLSLYEAVGMAGTPEVIPQEQIADTGSDVNPNNNVNVMNGQPEEEVADGAMPEEDGMPVDPSMENDISADPSLVLEKEKFKKLYELFDDLLNYGNVFIENLKFVDIGLLDFKHFQKMKLYMQNIEKLNDKINSYMINIFNSEKYEKVLYSYILFRTEMITAIKGLREVLELNKTDDDVNTKTNNQEQ